MDAQSFSSSTVKHVHAIVLCTFESVSALLVVIRQPYGSAVTNGSERLRLELEDLEQRNRLQCDWESRQQQSAANNTENPRNEGIGESVPTPNP
jgi:hypothetical protein